MDENFAYVSHTSTVKSLIYCMARKLSGLIIFVIFATEIFHEIKIFFKGTIYTEKSQPTIS